MRINSVCRRAAVLPVALLIAACAVLITALSAPASAARPASSGCRWYHTGHTLTLTVADNGNRVCAHRGQVVSVVLSVDPAQAPDPAQWWAPIIETGGALQPLPQIAIAIRGTTLGRYQAVARGSATLSSARPVCPPARDGDVACEALVAWTVSITAR